MSLRSDYLTFLTSQGYTPNRAVLCDEGTGDPVEFYTSVALTPSGAPGWSLPSGFAARKYDATTDHDILAGSPAGYLGTTKQTVLFARRKHDTTARNAFAFGNTETADSTRFGAYLPFTDNTVYFYHGAAGGANITYAAGTPTTNIEFWGFVTGPAGSSIWKNGTKVNSNATARSWSLTTNQVRINKGNSVNGDIADVFALILIPDEVNDATMATWIAANYLTEAAPVITSPTVLADGTKGTAYSQAFSATGGASPYTWASSGGPAGITMNASSGVFSGTPTEAGLFHIVFTVTGDNDNSSEIALDLYVDDPLCIPQAVLSLARGAFTNNSRVGPHQDSAKKIALILRDADNIKKLNAQYTTNNGVTWASVLTSALTNNIVAHDSELDVDGTAVHVWTQESTSGRVAYHTFDLDSGTWTLENEEISASETIIVGALSGTILSSGVPAVVYESDLESVSAVNRKRMTYNDRVGGVWGTPLPLGDIGAAQSDQFGRLIPGDDTRSTMIMTIDPGVSVLSTPDFQLQVIRSDRTLSTISIFRTTGLLSTNPQFFMGDYATYRDGSDLILVVPVKLGGGSTIFSFVDSDTPASVSLGEVSLGNLVGEGKFVPIAMRVIDGTLYALDFAFPDLSSQSFVRLKTSASHLGPFAPSGMADQAGPTMGIITTTTQTMDANVVKRTCLGVDGIYIATAVPIGSIDGVTDRVKFEWLKISDLPTDSGLTLAEWLDSIETQEIDFCCSLPTITSLCPLPQAAVGEEYSFQLVAAGATLFELIGGALPSGFSMSPSGLITSAGPVTSAQLGTFSIKVRAT